MNKEITINTNTIVKIIKMFRPADRGLGPHEANEMIQGPNDRALIGYETFFPKDWLIEDYGFTEEEAKEFMKLVNELYVEEADND